MKEYYTLGRCSQCDEQVMVKDTDGSFRTKKKNWTQKKVEINKDTAILTVLCSNCFKDTKPEIILQRLCHKKSIVNSATKEQLKNLETTWQFKQ